MRKEDYSRHIKYALKPIHDFLLLNKSLTIDQKTELLNQFEIFGNNMLDNYHKNFMVIDSFGSFKKYMQDKFFIESSKSFQNYLLKERFSNEDLNQILNLLDQYVVLFLHIIKGLTQTFAVKTGIKPKWGEFKK